VDLEAFASLTLATLIKYPWQRLCRSLFRSTNQSIKDQPIQSLASSN